LLVFEAISCKQKHASRSTFLCVLCSCFVSVHCLIAPHTEWCTEFRLHAISVFPSAI
jgi:hypothetical protein